MEKHSEIPFKLNYEAAHEAFKNSSIIELLKAEAANCFSVIDQAKFMKVSKETVATTRKAFRSSQFFHKYGEMCYEKAIRTCMALGIIYPIK